MAGSTFFNARLTVCAALAALTGCGSSNAPTENTAGGVAGQTGLDVQVLSNRPDLVSGGDALVEVILPPGVSANAITMSLNGKDVSSLFSMRPNGRDMGLVTGLRDGVNVLVATQPFGAGKAVTITNHPIGGPIFSGPQVMPWPCLDGAVDLQCNRPVTYTYKYKSTDLTACAAAGSPGSSCFLAYDPKNPPSSVPMTTTDQGKTVPYIIRVETGTQDRGQYQIAVLFDPTKDWQPWAPQAAWNGKTANYGGSGCGTHHGEGATSGEFFNDQALGLGFLTWQTQLSDNTQNCNLVVQAESLMMAKEHIVEAYGPIRYTIGNGGSGGSIKLQQAANAYPGIYDGIIPIQSFVDTWSTGATEVLDCRYLVDYFDNPAGWGLGVVWTPAQEAAVMGQPTVSICQAWINVYGFDWALNPRSEALAADPVHQKLNSQSCNVTSNQAWDPQSNPSGVRCDLSDYMVNILGRRPQDGLGDRPHDNVGVQYGLSALLAGMISPAQFVDLNAAVGSRDINYSSVASRAVANPGVLALAYRSGLFNEANNMHLPMIDMRGNDAVEIHHNYHSHEMRARLDRSNGNHDNQVIWVLGPTPSGDSAYIPKALTVMDQWLSGIEGDTSDLPYVQKVAKYKPSGAHDLCTDGNGDELPTGTCDLLYPFYAEPRAVAGESMIGDIVKCQLKPLQQNDYKGVQFTPAEWDQLQSTFPDGVCDYSKPGVGQQPSATWLDYSIGSGGLQMPAEPLPRGWASAAFR